MKHSLRGLAWVAVIGAGPLNLSAALSSSSYIDEGLLLQLDGVENVSRGGAHVSGSTVWNDLVSGGELYFPISGTASFVDADALAVTSTWQTSAEGPKRTQIHDAVLNAAYSAEIAYDETSATILDPSWTSKRPAGQMLQFGHPNHWMGIDWNLGNRQTDCWVGFSPRGNSRAPGINLLASLGADKIRGAHTLGVRQATNDCTIFFDGENVKSSTVDASAQNSQNFYFYGVILNGGYSYDDAGMNGKYHSVRFYNRALSDDEQAVNRAVDAIRFFGGNPAAFTLPTGWRFVDVETDVKLERNYATVAASVDAGGTVRVGAGEASSSVDIWNEHPRLPVRTLSAVPSDGYRFMRWRGIESANPYQAIQESVVVTGQVVAVFYPIGPHTLNSRSYVAEGLVAQFDGVENVTRGGAHVADSRVWNDLVTDGGYYFPVSGTASFSEAALSVTRSWQSLGALAIGSQNDVIGTTTRAGTFSAEIAYDQTEPTDTPDGTYGAYFAQLLQLSHPDHWMGLDLQDSQIGYAPLEFGREKGLRYAYSVGAGGTRGQHTFAVSQAYDTMGYRVVWDGAVVKSGVVEPDGKTYGNWGVRLNGYFANSGITGKYHSIRVYNRVLTDDEHVVNRAIDAVRFFGKDPADFTLPVGYRFGTAAGICLERQRTIGSSNASLGLVGVCSSEGKASVNIWIDVASPQVELNAMPTVGCKFVRWEGAISGANLESPTGTFMVSGNVTAVFKKIIGLKIILK